MIHENENFVFVVHVPQFADTLNDNKGATAHGKSARSMSSGQMKLSSGVAQYTRAHKVKPWPASSTSNTKRRKNVRTGEAKWYIDSLSSMNTNCNDTTVSSTQSTPTMEQPAQKLGK